MLTWNETILITIGATWTLIAITMGAWITIWILTAMKKIGQR